jgi:NAD-dependent dihydropyrimidine dehydrogenase PreA subunit
LAIAPVPNIFENSSWGRAISKEEAYSVIRTAEEAALVHMTNNIQNGHYYICNCCGCCCGVLRSINEYNILNATNSHYYAEIDPDVCIGCGVCSDERCQVNAIQVWDEYSTVNKEKCIGCGLCVSTCPTEAVKLVRKQPEEWAIPPRDEMSWFDEKARGRGVDFSRFK